MHYDAVTHTRKAIRNLQSQVRLFLRKHNEDTLPQINRKSNMIAYRQSPLTLRNSRQKSQFESPSEIQTSQSRQHNTISFNEMETNNVNVTILKPRSSKKAKIVLPKFERRERSRVQSRSQKNSVQLIEHSLVEEANGTLSLKLKDKQIEEEQKYRQKVKKPNKIPKIPRYHNKATLNQKLQVEKTEDSINVGEPKREQCFSPWERQEDSDLIQMTRIYEHS